ncbi:MFS transporter [Mycobacterium nebraskense]|uniref:MFS transporter n=1 Tax=Mycobacterium nebraskense TaxID=244292 RepID=UPI00061820A7|nr:MFS transporter [Mycobacterium nebraskense]KKC03816.1 MFS transporter permease [Mycobacterium nebraskense]KLO33839.1 MFS transporter permease [Mycobacterium nebraskense]MBI2695632.1 MFS transporter [Mycobacterium nebraskense]MCV7116827.1 MFS transporter [Mycobacterium nebraskense]
MVALGYGVISPAMPAFAHTFGVSIKAVTFLVTVFSLSRLCFAPVSGLLVQRLGERRIYIGGLLIVALSTIACAYSQTYWQLLFFRGISGVGSTMFYVSALGLMIHISPPDARGRIAGLFTTSFMIGAVGGPAIGGLTAGWGLTAPFIVYGVAMLGVAVVLFYGLRHSELAAPLPPTRSTVTMRQALRFRSYWAALLANFATGWAAFGLRVALVPLFLADVMGKSVGVIGVALAAFAAGNALAVVPSGFLSDRMGRRTLLIIGLATSGVATAALGAVSTLPAFMVAAAVSGATTGIFMSPMQAAVADILGSEARAGLPVAAVQMLSDLGAIVGSVTVGWAAENLSFAWGFGISGIVLLIAAVGWVLAPETRTLIHPEHGLAESQADVELA